MSHTQSEVIEAIVKAIGAESRWRIVSSTDRLVRVIPREFDSIMPPLGVSTAAPASAWLTLDFWIQSPQGGLGVFWWSSPVRDKGARNRILTALADDGERTGFLYRGTRGPWNDKDEVPFSGKTVSGRWWPKGGLPSLVAAREEVRRELEVWNKRLPSIMESVVSVAELKGVTQSIRPAPAPKSSRSGTASSTKSAKPTTPPRRSSTAASPSATTPRIPKDIRAFVSPPHYTSIFEIYPKEKRIYGTEDLYGDWNGEVLFMAKDAGSSKNFLPHDKGGFGWAWVHNPARPTNRNLIPLAEQLPCGKLYASFLGPLLRNDGQESGALEIDDRVRQFVQRLFLWTVASMPRLRTVAVLGHDAWRELASAVGEEAETRRWKRRHLTGQPLEIQLEGRSIALVALNHPARIPAGRLMQQPGWKCVLRNHA